MQLDYALVRKPPRTPQNKTKQNVWTIALASGHTFEQGRCEIMTFPIGKDQDDEESHDHHM